MLRYIPGLIGAVVAMVAYRLLSMFDFSVRVLIFFFAYLVVTISIDTAMRRYGRKDK